MKSLSSALRSYTAVATAILLPLAARSQGQAAGERPQFEVASIKLNNGCQNNRNPEPTPRPGWLQIGCVTLQKPYPGGLCSNRQQQAHHAAD